MLDPWIWLDLIGIVVNRLGWACCENENKTGGTWLFFGDRRFDSDFLYRDDWEKWLETKHLEKIELAFSRDQEEKVYVQHKLLDNQKEIYQWIDEGAYFYLCGDMKSMAKDVNKTLLEIIKTQGGVSIEKAGEYLRMLKREKRFQQDVYWQNIRFITFVTFRWMVAPDNISTFAPSNLE